MALSESRKKWDEDNTKFFGIKLQFSTDKDILDYFDSHVDKAKKIGIQTIVKAALREYIANHTPAKEVVPPPWEDEEEEESI